MTTSPFASNLTVTRQASGLSLVDMSRRTGIHESRLTGFESGTELPTPAELVWLCDSLAVSIDRLLRQDLAEIARLRSERDVQFLVLDIDGVLTDGSLYYGADGQPQKRFNVKDGVAISQLTKKGFQVAFLSAGSSVEQVRARAERLGVQRVKCEVKSKIDVLQYWCGEMSLPLNQVAFIGDDHNDLEPMAHVGLAACPADAAPEVKSTVHWILATPGGAGCVREFVDAFLS